MPDGHNSALPMPTHEQNGQPKDYSDKEMYARLCRLLGFTCEQMDELRRCIPDMQRFRGYCTTQETLARRCKAVEETLKINCCSAQTLFGRPTIDSFSDQAQVNLDQIVQNLTGFQNQFPVAPGQKIRLEQIARPGWVPIKIWVDLSLANNGQNYLDIELQFYTGGGGTAQGMEIGPKWRAAQFLDKDGRKIPLCFPEWRGCPVDIGSAEKLAVELRHIGGVNNLESAFIYIQYDNSQFYGACKTEC